MPVDPELVRLFAAHCNYRGRPRDETLHWASERADDLTWKAPEEGWDLYQQVLDLIDEPYAVMYAAIAIVEDLIDEHPAWFFERLEDAVFRDPKVAYGVSGLWCRPARFESRFAALVQRARDVSGSYSLER